ncbi:hypothetical protein [Aeromicrobium sp. Sec7.5]|uniref:hypothetical protein n=1 Tax=Aeromicrobium sp. Sec7.5 TaxID=3121276 RepID=UPI002FE4B617
MTPAWDALIAAFEHAILADPTDLGGLRDLVVAAIHDGTVDAELDPGQTARLLTALAGGTRELDPSEADVATALLVATRWLHPPRTGARLEPGPAI